MTALSLHPFPGRSPCRYRTPQLHDLLRSILAHVKVDEAWYRRRYRDVDAAISAGKHTSAREHFVVAGYFEGRFPCEILVDERWYLKAYPDVDQAFRHRLLESAQAHFEQGGYREGRLPREGWHLLYKVS